MEAEGKGQATRAMLIETARELFTQRGYSAVGTEELVRHAGVTRGALYHHFRDKRDLFKAVFLQMEAEIVDEILARVAESGVDDPIEALEVGIRAFLDACEDQARVQVGLIDAPAVLGWSEWRQIGAEHAMSLIVTALEAARAVGRLSGSQVEPLAHLMIGALGEAAMLIAHASDRAAARQEVEVSVAMLLEGLRAPPA